MIKMCQVKIVLLLTVAAFVLAADDGWGGYLLPRDYRTPKADWSPKIVIGDMEMTKEQYKLRYSNDTGIKRNGWIDKKYRWPGGIVPVVIAPEFDAKAISTIKAAAAEISRGTCVKFQFNADPSSQPNHLYIIKSDGPGQCSAAVGYIRQQSKLKLDPGYCQKGSIIHELLHVLGFYHMHEAAERDNFIEINFNNIRPDLKDQFEKSNQVSLFGTAYDYSV